MATHTGSCHCKAVTFTVEAPDEIEVNECNCSICKLSRYVHLIVEQKDFTLLSGAADISTYSFNTHTAKHTFCKHCGIKSFYTPRSHPDGFSVNVNCLDQSTFKFIKYGSFDGDKWEENIATFREELA